MIDALTAFGLASGVARSAPVYVLVSSLHIASLGVLIGAIGMVDLRLMGRLLVFDVAAVVVLRRTAILAVSLAVTTGVLLLSARPAEYFENRVFLAKLALVAIGIAHALMFETKVRRLGLEALLEAPGSALHGVVSLATWIGVLVLGRLIAFV